MSHVLQIFFHSLVLFILLQQIFKVTENTFEQNYISIVYVLVLAIEKHVIFICFFIEKGERQNKERQRECFCCWFTPLNACSCLDWARQKSLAWNLEQLSPIGRKNLISWNITHLFQGLYEQEPGAGSQNQDSNPVFLDLNRSILTTPNIAPPIYILKPFWDVCRQNINYLWVNNIKTI